MVNTPVFTAKIRRNDGVQHPLLAHLADVSSVFEALVSSPVVAARLESAAGCPLDSSFIGRLCVLAALHDIGKFTPTFQQRLQTGDKRLPGHIAVLKGLWERGVCERFNASLPFVGEWQHEDEVGYDALLLATFSHHGDPIASSPDMRTAEENGRHWRPKDGFDPFVGLQELHGLLRSWFPAAFFPTRVRPSASPALSHLFAGLVMLADWMGSDTDFFPFCGERGRPALGDPMVFSRPAAALCLRRAGLEFGAGPGSSEVAYPGEPGNFEDFFPFPPNAVQRAVDELPLDPPGGLVILEAETGSGKTEAALRYFHRLFCTGRVSGLYLANPLRLAAKQMHSRLRAFVTDAFAPSPPSTVLAIPGYLLADAEEGYRLPDLSVIWPDEVDPKRFWACEHPKRFLAASIACGTIDQALLAGLRTRHAHLRAAALSRSLLIIDEAHASDAYMTVLTHNLIRFMRLVGGRVLVMSATLGQSAREKFLAEARGEPASRLRPGNSESARAAPYPLVSFGDSQVAPTPAGAGKSVVLELHPLIQTPDAVALLAARYARDGARVLVLRNTVDRAVETVLALEGVLADRPELLFRVGGVACPHHGRFAREDRLLLDTEVLFRFGKQASDGVRPPAVLAATQTIEQSLDVDFDLLITDLCPMDVLLQRLGRLHRHVNNRPPDVREPRCIVLTSKSSDPDWFLSEEARRYGFGDERAYENVVSVAASLGIVSEYVEAGRLLRIPADNREVVERATHDALLDTLAEGLGPKWVKSWQEIRGAKMARGGAAHQNLIDFRHPFSSGSAGGGELEKRATTRLGLNDQVVCFETALPGPFGALVTSMRVPAWLFGGTPGEIQPASVIADRGTIRFSLAGKRFLYDRFGLRKDEGGS